jgi:hypothetical protein
MNTRREYVPEARSKPSARNPASLGGYARTDRSKGGVLFLMSEVPLGGYADPDRLAVGVRVDARPDLLRGCGLGFRV